MKKNKSLVAIIVITIYIIAVTGFILSLAQETIAGRQSAEQRFRNLVRETQKALNVNDVHSEDFLNAFLVSLDNVSDIAGIELKDKTSILLSYPSDSISNANICPSLITPYSEDIYTSNGNPLKLKAEIYILKPSSIYHKGRLAFLVIFAAALICLLYIIYINIYDTDEQKKEDSEEEKDALLEDSEEDYSLRKTETKQPKVNLSKKEAVENKKEENKQEPENVKEEVPEAVEEASSESVNEDEPESEEDDYDDNIIMDVQDEDDSMDEESSLDEEPEMEDYEEENEFEEEESEPAQEELDDYEEVQQEEQSPIEDEQAASNYTEPAPSMMAFDEEISERARITAEEMAALQAEFKDDYSKSSNAVVDEDIDEKYQVIYTQNNIIEEYKERKPEYADDELAEPIQKPRAFHIEEEKEIDTEPKAVTETIIESMPESSEPEIEEEDAPKTKPFTYTPIYQAKQIDDTDENDDMDDLELELDDDDESFALDANESNDIAQNENVESYKSEKYTQEEPEEHYEEPSLEQSDIITENISSDIPNTDSVQKEDIFENVTAETTTDSSENNWNPTEIPTVDDIVPQEEKKHVTSEDNSNDEYSIQNAYDEIDASNNAIEQNDEDTFSDEDFFDDFEDDPYFSDDEETAFVDSSEVQDTEYTPAAEQKEDDYIPALEVSTPQSQNAEEAAAAAAQTPAGLYSDKTGFCWESYMIPRLDNELSRAAASNQDLSFFAIKISDINWETEEGKELAKSISETINFPDCIFESGVDGCTAIMPNVRIDESLATADALYSNITDILDRYDNADNHSIGIGISARSLRIISGERLSNEASEALNHALQDKESPIVAFKVNPQKYRNFLAAQAAEEENRQKEG